MIIWRLKEIFERTERPKKVFTLNQMPKNSFGLHLLRINQVKTNKVFKFCIIINESSATCNEPTRPEVRWVH